MDDQSDDSLVLNLEDDQLSICSGGIFSETASVITQQSNESTVTETNASKSKIDLSQIGNKKRRTALYQKQRAEHKKVFNG